MRCFAESSTTDVARIAHGMSPELQGLLPESVFTGIGEEVCRIDLTLSYHRLGPAGFRFLATPYMIQNLPRHRECHEGKIMMPTGKLS